MSDSHGGLPSPTDNSGGYTPTVNLSYLRREMRVYSLSEAELDSIVSHGSALDLAFLGISSGALVTLFATLFSVTIPDPLKHATFVGATIVSAGFTIFFGFRTLLSVRESKRKLAKIKEPPPEIR